MIKMKYFLRNIETIDYVATYLACLVVAFTRYFIVDNTTFIETFAYALIYSVIGVFICYIVYVIGEIYYEKKKKKKGG